MNKINLETYDTKNNSDESDCDSNVDNDIDSDEEKTSSNDNEDEEIDQDSNEQEESKSYKTGESPGDMDDILNAMGGMDYDDELDEGEDIMETMSDPKVKKAQSL